MNYAQSLPIGPVTLKNRFLMAPVKTAYGTPQGGVSERHLQYYANLARGGVAMIILEPVAVSQSGREHPRQLTVHRPDSRKELGKIVDQLHSQDTLACLNLNHAGRAANPKATGMSPQAPSAISCPATGQTPEILQTQEIEGILEGYRRALQVAIAAGFDAVEIQAGHGYLVQQFLDGRTNQRADDYGRDRTLFCKKLFELVRRERGNLAVLVRISADDFVPGGFGPDQNAVILKLSETYGFDAIHCGLGNACDSQPWYYSHMALPEKSQREAVASIRRRTRLPLIAAGRMGDVDKLNSYRDAQLVDGVALGRPLIADPAFVTKYLSGNTAEITYCGYCLQGCLANVKNGSGIGCLANPAIDRAPLHAATPRSIAVVGGGPAGMAAATQCAAMGHRVTLFEQAPQLGGQFAMAWQAPHKESMERPFRSLLEQTLRSDARIELSTKATLERLRSFDHRIIATGSQQRIPDIPGLDSVYSMTGLEFFARSKPVKGPRVLIIGAGMVGIEAAELLADQGYEVAITKRSGTIANDMEPITRALMLKRLEAKENLLISTGTTVLEFTAQHVKYVRHEVFGEWAPFDTVIIAAGMEPDNRLHLALQEVGCFCELVGDAETPADIYQATRSGYLAAARLA